MSCFSPDTTFHRTAFLPSLNLFFGVTVCPRTSGFASSARIQRWPRWHSAILPNTCPIVLYSQFRNGLPESLMSKRTMSLVCKNYSHRNSNLFIMFLIPNSFTRSYKSTARCARGIFSCRAQSCSRTSHVWSLPFHQWRYQVGSNA